MQNCVLPAHDKNRQFGCPARRAFAGRRRQIFKPPDRISIGDFVARQPQMRILRHNILAGRTSLPCLHIKPRHKTVRVHHHGRESRLDCLGNKAKLLLRCSIAIGNISDIVRHKTCRHIMFHKTCNRLECARVVALGPDCENKAQQPKTDETCANNRRAKLDVF